MKKFFTTLLLMFVVMGGYAYDVEIDGIYYNLVPKAKEAIVTYNKIADSYYGNNDDYLGSVSIPSTITYNDITYSVTSIGEYAFYYCGLTSLTIPNSIMSIGERAFEGCHSLASVHISDIASWCKIRFDDTPLYNAHLYLGNEEIKDLVIPSSVTSIESRAFDGCSCLTSVIIPSSVTSIGNRAFSYCTNLTSVTIPNSVASIGNGAFLGCSSLASVHISDIASWCKIKFDDNPLSYARHLYLGNEEIKDLVIPSSVTSIESKAFENCSSLISVVIPNSVTYIGYLAFYNCSCLTSVTIPNSVTDIGYQAFSDCSALTSVTIGKSVINIKESAFANCKNLETFTCLAEKVPSIKTDAFKDSYVYAATLIVPESSLQAYKTTAPWSEFGTFKTVEGGDVPSTPRCATPSIAYENGKLYYVTATPGATVVSNVVVEDAKTSYDACVPLTATYNITAYATKSGYDDSDAATATLVWATATFTPGETTNAKEMTIDALPLLITQEDGMVTISGIADGATVTAYGTNGTTVASAKAIGNAALLNLSDLQGKVAVLNVNGKSAKVAIK